MTETAQQQEKAQFRQRESKVWWWLGGLFIVSLVLGGASYWQLKRSARIISPALVKINKQGKSLDLQGCASQVITWTKQCTALKVLCESWILQMMDACLDGRPRSAACQKLDLGRTTGHFSYTQCKPRKPKNRTEKKICAKTYSALWSYCQHQMKKDTYNKKKGVKAGSATKLPTEKPAKAKK